MMKSKRSGRRYKALVAVATALVALSACGTGSSGAKTDSPNQRLIDEQSDARILFESVKDVFAERGIDSALAVDEAMVVASEWEPVNRELRHRMIVRVIEVHQGRGVALNVTSEYLRRKIVEGEEIWVPADDRLTRERARRDEMKLGEAIKERFDERKE